VSPIRASAGFTAKLPASKESKTKHMSHFPKSPLIFIVITLSPHQIFLILFDEKSFPPVPLTIIFSYFFHIILRSAEFHP